MQTLDVNIIPACVRSMYNGRSDYVTLVLHCVRIICYGVSGGVCSCRDVSVLVYVRVHMLTAPRLYIPVFNLSLLSHTNAFDTI